MKTIFAAGIAITVSLAISVSGASFLTPTGIFVSGMEFGGRIFHHAKKG